MEFLEIGKITKIHGLKGRMKVISYLQSHRMLQSLPSVYLRRDGGRKARYGLKDIRIGNRSFILGLEGVEDMESAGGLMGCDVLIPFDKLEKLPQDEYYWQELLGLSAVTEEGRPLGRIEAIFPTGSNDVYVCRDGETEILLPAVGDVIRQVDLQNGIMVVRLLEGLQ
ncbi:MAG: 16S rRNA processing protein RimM [Deltaproteobacteria bacterium]|nr:16S rRNA processing protein RimM [Deltaproteobacteria bacterium]